MKALYKNRPASDWMRVYFTDDHILQSAAMIGGLLSYGKNQKESFVNSHLSTVYLSMTSQFGSKPVPTFCGTRIMAR